MRGFILWILLGLAPLPALAGPYAPGAGQSGSTAVSSTNSGLVSWASGWTNYIVGSGVVPEYQTPEFAMGPADCDYQDPYNVCTLGDGGEITMMFSTPIRDTDGFDFVVFENSFNGLFLELGFVEVSADGTNFIRFPSASWSQAPIPFQGGAVEATNLEGLAGKYGGIWGQDGVNNGTPFDLAEVGLDEIRYVRIVDIIGDGRSLDSVREWHGDNQLSGDPIYDPHPTSVTAGFDLDAIGAFITRSYEDWILAKFPYPSSLQADALREADPDGDGLSNLLEFAFATDPRDASEARRPRIDREGGQTHFTFWRDANKAGLTYAVEVTENLLDWREVARSEQGASVLVNVGVEGITVREVGDNWLKQVMVTDAGDLHTSRFWRVRIQ